MTSIATAICRIFPNNFKRFCLRNKRVYLDFLLHFWSVHQKKDGYPSLIISEIIDAERRSYLDV